MILKHEVNSNHRQRYIRVKMVLFDTLILMTSLACYLFPDPFKHEVYDKNAKTILRHLEVYNRYEENPKCKIIVNGVVRIVVTLIEHSPNWRDRIYFFGELVRAGEWNRRALNHPRRWWKETKPYGGEYGININA